MHRPGVSDPLHPLPFYHPVSSFQSLHLLSVSTASRLLYLLPQTLSHLSDISPPVGLNLEPPQPNSEIVFHAYKFFEQLILFLQRNLNTFSNGTVFIYEIICLNESVFSVIGGLVRWELGDGHFWSSAPSRAYYIPNE